MSKVTFSARHITWLLIALIAFVAVAVGFANMQLRTMLQDQITKTNQLKADALQGDDNLSKAKTLELYAATHAADIDRAAAVVAQAKTYQYQNQIINDITSYANTVGITILEFNFPDSTQKKQPVPGLNSIEVTVSLQNPIQYTKFVQFLKLIEQNLTKMQITTIDVSPDDKTSGFITAPSVGLEVYVK